MQVKVPERVKYGCCGIHHNIFVDTRESTMWLQGDNGLGQFMFKKDAKEIYKCPIRVCEKFRSIACGGYFSVILVESGEVRVTGEIEVADSDYVAIAKRTFAPGKKRIVQIAAGDSFFLVLDEHGNVHLYQAEVMAGKKLPIKKTEIPLVLQKPPPFSKSFRDMVVKTHV